MSWAFDLRGIVPGRASAKIDLRVLRGRGLAAFDLRREPMGLGKGKGLPGSKGISDLAAGVHIRISAITALCIYT